MKEQPLNAGYLRAIEVAKQLSGKDRGAASWLAVSIKVPRQLLFYWSKVGFPEKIIPKVCKVTGLPPDEVTTVTIDMPALTWKQICQKAPKPLTDQATIRRSHG